MTLLKDIHYTSRKMQYYFNAFLSSNFVESGFNRVSNLLSKVRNQINIEKKKGDL